MTESISDAVKKAAHNAVIVEGEAQKNDASISGTFEREKGDTSFGVTGGISKKEGWSVKGFFKKVWG
jgi:hypothetical protein